MPIASQTVRIDFIKKTILLDKKATVAQGNIIKQRDTLLVTVSRQDDLIKSLRAEISIQEKELYVVKSSKEDLKAKNIEKDFELKKANDVFDIKEVYWKQEIKSERKKKWTWISVAGAVGLIGGILISSK